MNLLNIFTPNIISRYKFFIFLLVTLLLQLVVLGVVLMAFDFSYSAVGLDIFNLTFFLVLLFWLNKIGFALFEKGCFKYKN